MRRIVCLIVSIFLASTAYAAPSNSISIPNSFTANTTIQSSQVNDNNNEVQSKYNAHSHTDLTQVGTITSGVWNGTAITTQYGGTGKDFSAVASGSIVYFSANGTMSTLGAGTSGYILQTNGAGVAPNWISSGSGAKHAISRGFEVSASVLKTSVTINPGTLYHGTTYVDVATSSTLVTTTAGDYASGSVVNYGGGAGWNYIGVSTTASQTVKGVFFLGAIPPAYSDTAGNTGGTLIYSRIGSDYYRVIGAIRQNTSNQSALGYFQNKESIMLDVPVTVTSTPSAAAWSSAIDCSSAIPSISRQGIFGLWSREAAGNATATFIRPNNSNWALNSSNGIYGSFSGGTDNELGGQRICATDSSQQIQIYNDTADDYVRVDVEGYCLNII